MFADELAKKTGISNDSDSLAKIVSKLRWYRNSAGAVIILKRGADRKVLATISPKQGDWTHLYPSWQKALADLDEKKRLANVSRMSHDGINTGTLPVKE